MNTPCIICEETKFVFCSVNVKQIQKCKHTIILPFYIVFFSISNELIVANNNIQLFWRVKIADWADYFGPFILQSLSTDNAHCYNNKIQDTDIKMKLCIHIFTFLDCWTELNTNVFYFNFSLKDCIFLQSIFISKTLSSMCTLAKKCWVWQKITISWLSSQKIQNYSF